MGISGTLPRSEAPQITANACFLEVWSLCTWFFLFLGAAHSLSTASLQTVEKG